MNVSATNYQKEKSSILLLLTERRDEEFGQEREVAKGVVFAAESFFQPVLQGVVGEYGMAHGDAH